MHKADLLVVARYPDADMGMGLLLAIAREIPRNDAAVRAGEWGKRPLPLATRLRGKRPGILGPGRVGRALAKRAEAFDLSIAYHDRNRIEGVRYAYHDSAVALAKHVDFFVICAAADRNNRGSIGRDVFDALGLQGILVNLARGSIVDEPVLLDYLATQRIRGAALDVFWNEPSIDARFATLPDVVLQPHRASATIETRAAMAQRVRDNLVAFFAGAPLVTEYPLPAKTI